jgi:hypothetical protein
MDHSKKIDLSRLLGFALVGEDPVETIDVRESILDARLGAKVGLEAWVACELRSRPEEVGGTVPDKVR